MADRALPILEMTDDSIRINKRNFKSVLDKVGVRPFALISINGATRTGKSYALNYFIRYFEAKSRKNSTSDSSWFDSELSSNFEWRNGLDRTTVGINLWSKPYFVKDPTSGQKMAVLLMDCQGLFDPQTTDRQNAIIFSLSTLCSSLSIFNLMRHVDENVFQQLQLFTGYANMVSPNPGSGGNGGKGGKNENLQKLIFLIRDFDAIQQYHHGYHDEKSKPRGSPRNYFRHIFLMDPQAQQQGDQATIIPAQNLAIRKKIRSSYHQIGAYLLPDPGRKFRRDPKAPTHKEFEKHVKGFVHLLNSEDEGSFLLAPKRYGGVPVTGQEFMKYVDQWAELCKNSGENFPDVQTVSESMATIQNSTAMDKAMAYYNEEMDKILAKKKGVGEDIFVSKCEKLEKKSLKIFEESPRLQNDEMMEKYGRKLKRQMMKKFKTNKETNSTRLAAHIQHQKYLEEQQKNEEQSRELRRVKKQVENLREEVATASAAAAAAKKASETPTTTTQTKKHDDDLAILKIRTPLEIALGIPLVEAVQDLQKDIEKVAKNFWPFKT